MRKQKGFTLIEVVVAFAVFALGVTAIYGVVSAASLRTVQATQRQVALLTAQSLLSELRVRPAPWPDEERGSTRDGLDWEVTVMPFEAPIRADSPWSAFEVRVDVHDSQRPARAVVLTSVELAFRGMGLPK